MFRASSRPLSVAQQPLESGDSSAFGRGRGCYYSCWAPNDGRDDAQNMLSCT
jgi:hypothetical protein